MLGVTNKKHILFCNVENSNISLAVYKSRKTKNKYIAEINDSQVLYKNLNKGIIQNRINKKIT